MVSTPERRTVFNAVEDDPPARRRGLYARLLVASVIISLIAVTVRMFGALPLTAALPITAFTVGVDLYAFWLWRTADR